MSTSALPTRTRLHITPFNAELFNKIVPDSAKASATDISYHSIETFPERGFGYIELPKEEAEKLRKKLHGATLKGAKMRVEEARPAKKRKSEETEEERSVRKKAKREKAKKEDGVLPGYELEEGRHVKRGWTDGKERKEVRRKEKKGEKVKVKEGKGKKESKDGKKVVFKTAVPPNAMPVEEKAKGKKEKKAKKEKVGKTPKVVHEFEKTRKPTGGLMDADPVQRTLTYEEGKGWVDEDGSVVEPEPRSKRKRREREVARQAAEEVAEASPVAEKVTAKAPAKSPNPATIEAEVKAGDTESYSGSAESSDSISSDMSSSDPSSEDEASPTTSPERPTALPTSDLKITPPPPIQPPREIHPLEALYKRAPPPTLTSDDTAKPSLRPLNTSFSFFNPDDVSVSDTEQPALPPQTPHTKQDLEWRALRSAAPTPDTAAIGRKFSFPFASAGGDEDDDDDMDVDTNVPALKLGVNNKDLEKAENGAGGESEFRKWFFEHRGENNRAWKRKRREGKKVLRQRENRRVGRRVV